MSEPSRLPITVLLATKNEEVNIAKCLAELGPAARVIVIDSHSTDRTIEIATSMGAEVVQFTPRGSYPKKRQWALDSLEIQTPWVLLLDADEVVPSVLWQEIGDAIKSVSQKNGFLIRKEFHFLGKRLRFGGFSFAAVLLIRHGKAKFENLGDSDTATHSLDMEVHERVIVEGSLGHLRCSLIHEDFKGLQAYLDRHNRYSSWEAGLRHRYLSTGTYGQDTIRPRLFGNAQERRRFFKSIVIRLPIEPWIWFAYHFLFRLGFLDGRRGLIACQIRAAYISQVHAKVYELKIRDQIATTLGNNNWLMGASLHDDD